jgi:hypothetical protein
MVVRYGHHGTTYTLEDEDDWEIFTDRFSQAKDVDRES